MWLFPYLAHCRNDDNYNNNIGNYDHDNSISNNNNNNNNIINNNNKMNNNYMTYVIITT